MRMRTVMEASTRLRIVIGIIVVLAAASWFSFGCGGVVNSAAPSGGGDTPVAVEIPNINFDQVSMDTITFE